MKIMKKVLCLVLSISLFVSFMVSVYANDRICVKIDGAQIDFDVLPQSINNRVMVPLRAIFEALGATVQWDDNTQTVTSKKGNVTINLTLNTPVMFVNGTVVKLDAAACAINGRTLVPVRAIAEAFDLNVRWDNDAKTVFITTKEDTGETEEYIEHNVHPKEFEMLKNLIIDEGRHLTEEDSSYVIYHKVDETNQIMFSYDPEYEEIAIYQKAKMSGGEYSLMILIDNDTNPSVLATAKTLSGLEDEIFGEFPVDGMFIETLNTSTAKKEFSNLLNAEFAVVDFLLESYTGFTFADFGMYYDIYDD